ncbi:MAG TPA: hypothetical protein VK003_15430 [Oceanobacillus sp.]|nr:hypothetical protein [Oceanobacillus sp.]
MPFEYEALVGHLYVVGGRSISTAPPGSLVEVSPRKAARGREADTIFTLVLPSGDVVAPASFYEQMAALAAERYFDSTGSVTAGMRQVFSHLNENLYDHNARNPTHYEASMVCAVLRGSDLYLARVGAGVGILRHNGEIQQFPADFNNDEALFGPPLGVYPSPDVKMAMYQVTSGTRLVLADVALADMEMSKISAALALPDIGDVLVAIKELVQTQITLTIVEFVPPEVPVPLPVREVEATGGAVTSTSEVRAAAPQPTTTPTSEAEAPPREPGKPRLSEARNDNAKRMAGAAALGAGKALKGVNDTLDKVMPLPKEGQRTWVSTPAATGIAVLIPVVVVVIVLVMWLTGTGQSEFDLCVNQANEAAEVARSVASSDVTGTLAAWNAVLVFVEQCNSIRTGDPAMAALTSEARTVIDALLQITRRPLGLVATLPSATLKRGVLQGEDLYVLDDGNDLVYRITLPVEGTDRATQEPIAAMRRQGTVNQFTIGDIIDIAYTEDGSGVSQGNVITALDRNGVLVDCPPRFLQNCSAQQINTDTWNNPVAMQFWRGRLYILDPAANQIWRYDPSGGAYPNTPIEYFVGEGRPDIRSAVDFAIDAEGTVYILTSGGEMLRYTSGNRQGFDFANFPEEGALRGVTSMFLSTNPVDLMVYYVNPTNRTIYQTTHAGAFVNSYRAENESQFEQIADVVVDPNRRIMYVLSGNSVYAFRRG